jgi:hypothetical protein
MGDLTTKDLEKFHSVRVRVIWNRGLACQEQLVGSEENFRQRVICNKVSYVPNGDAVNCDIAHKTSRSVVPRCLLARPVSCAVMTSKAD